MSDKVLSQSDYEAAIAGGLKRLGIDEATSGKLIRARWPMSPVDVLSECAGRGRLLTIEDLQRWFDERYGVGKVSVEEPLSFHSHNVNAFLQWALQNNVGGVTFAGQLATEAPQAIEAILEREQSAWN